MGHVVVAKLLKFEVGEIHIYPFGFSAMIHHFNHLHPVKIMIILVSGLGLHVVFPFFIGLLEKSGFISITYCDYLIHLNTSIFLFNLFPIYPLDGGRLLFAILRLFFDYPISKKVTYCCSFILIFVLFVISPFSMKIMLCFLLYLLIIEYRHDALDLVEFYYYRRKHFKV